MKKRIPAIILMFSLFLTGAFAANTYQKSINVEYGITVSLNAKPLNMTDVNGNPVQAFVYQGTTYVPIRAISENLGVNVNYDSTYNIAHLTDTQDAENYLYFLVNATNAASLMQGYVMHYQAMNLGNISYTTRFYPSASNIVKSTQDMISYIPIDYLYYDNAKKVNAMLDEMLDAFADMEDAYYNKQSQAFEDATKIINDNYMNISSIMIKSSPLTL